MFVYDVKDDSTILPPALTVSCLTKASSVFRRFVAIVAHMFVCTSHALDWNASSQTNDAFLIAIHLAASHVARYLLYRLSVS